ncbi:MAG: NAD-dependent succinate-semialdehyde dehydrogenase [Solirubrobacterales bacterium]|nr:NAD-dependent succinate-semialdehyde dehydrogenase [Solirubrobacterales bacterium]
MTLLPSIESDVVAAVPCDLFIAGEWRPASDAATFPVEDPATTETLAEVADATAQDADAALQAAHEAFQTWRHHPPRERGEILRRAYELIVARADELALLVTLEMGKPLAEAKAEVLYAANFFRWYAEEAVRVNGRFTTSETGQGRILTMAQPVGPCLFITPWNFPLAMGARKIGPALAAGCTIVVKPAEQTPLSMLALAQILDQAGLPAGVLNILTTSAPAEIMPPLINDPRTRKLSFTGSTEVGKILIAQSAQQVLRVSMELGGNAPFLVFSDADLDEAVAGAVIAKMRNGGEACVSANRFLVHESVAVDFSRRLADAMGAFTLGRGTDAGVTLGPLIDAEQRRKVVDLVDEAVGAGAELLIGGKVPDRAGYFYEPTVLTGVSPDAQMLHDEIFGPVAPITTFTDDEEAITRANETEYGLVAFVYTTNLKRAFNVIETLDTGMVGLNQGVVSNVAAPFGGVKQSGIGREGGPEGMGEFLETKYVAMNV